MSVAVPETNGPTIAGTPTPEANTATTPPLSATDASALSLISGYLGQYGLASLGQWAWAKWQNNESVDQIMLDLRSTDQYKARFPAMDALAKKGEAISEAAYISYETNIKQLVQQAGLPKGMYDTPDQIARLLTNDVSVAEAQNRLQLASQAVLTMPDSTRAALSKDFGLDSGHLAAYYLDDTKALPLLQRQLAAAQIAGAGLEQGIDIGADTATNLAAQGVSYTQAQQGLGAVAQTAALGAGPGETIGQGQRIASQFGDTGAANTLTRVVKGRLAQATGGGGAATGNAGISGLGTSTRQP